MHDGMTVIATFANEIEAEVARARLESLGIAGLVDTDNCDGMHPHLDLTVGVKLLVDKQDAAKAKEILADLQSSEAAPAWTCKSCGEMVEGNFTACWKCGREQA